MTSLGFLVLFVASTCSLTGARPASYDDYPTLDESNASAGSKRREVRETSVFAGEASDLLLAGNSPEEMGDGKKLQKNTSGAW